MSNDAEATHVLRCMEIQGGCAAVEERLVLPGLDVYVYSRPYEDAPGGGDVHYFSLCGGGYISRLILADVSGHGASVAELATSLRDLVRRNINRPSQTGMVRALNREFSELAQLSRFATAIVATYLASEGSLTLCNAGHPRPLWFQAAARQWNYLSQESVAAANLPLGIDEESPYEQFRIPLEVGDLVVAYTDAVTEAADASRTLLGESGLLELVRTIEGLDDPADVGRAILEALQRYRAGGPIDDDLTVVVLRRNGGGPRRASLGETLDAVAKVFRLKSV